MTIGVIGCGWLGLPLAECLVSMGYTVLGSTTHKDKLSALLEKGIDPVLFKLDPMPTGEHFNRLFQADLLVINIPPGRKRNPPGFYEEQIKYLKYQLQGSKVKKVIFISSTSYYPNTNDLVDTNTPYNLEQGSSEAVVQGEHQITQINQDLAILRCGGLMGGDRIPGKWFSGKPTKGANTPVNYVHRDDVIKVTSNFIVDWPVTQEKHLFNLVSAEHPTRKDVHERMAVKYGFSPPIWDEEATTPSKIVDSDFKEINLKSPLAF